MKKLISILAVMIAALLFSACGQDPVAELETQIAKEDNPNRRELFAEFAQIFRRERAKQPFDATRGLALAVVFDYPDYAEFFLERGADVNGTCINGASMLGVAAEQHFSEICRLLVKHGADVDSRSQDGKTPLMHALNNTDYDSTSSVRRLSGKSVDGKAERKKVAEFLFEKGADVNARAKDGFTALFFAVIRQDAEMARWLIGKGADVRVMADVGPGETVSAIEFAADRGNRALVLLLKEKGAKLPDLVPVPVVKIPGKSYAFGKYEVTQAQYASVMGANPSKFKGENLPVERVSWNDAVKFCEKLTAWERALGLISENQEYRLPTSDEWEHACRAGTATRFYTGDAESDLDRAGWYGGNSWSETHPVGQKAPNAFGLYDMHGNVWEWTATAEGSGRVNRGGGCGSDAFACGSSYGDSDSPGTRWGDLGFRVVLAPAE